MTGIPIKEANKLSLPSWSYFEQMWRTRKVILDCTNRSELIFLTRIKKVATALLIFDFLISDANTEKVVIGMICD